MEENLSKFITAILAIIIMFIFPLYIAYEKKDDISYALAVRYTQDFVDKVRSKGYITRELYQDYATRLLTTGNTYEIELEHRYVRFDPSGDVSNDNVVAVRNEEIYTTEHILNFMDNNEEHKYIMNVSDNFNVKIKNTNVTMATIIYNIVTVNMSSNNVRIYVEYGGKILADKWWGNVDFFPCGEEVEYRDIFLKSDRCKITSSLINVSNMNLLEDIEYGGTYETVLSIPADYVFKKVVIEVNGEDVTDSVFDETTGSVTIKSVTGDIVITAEAGPKLISKESGISYVGYFADVDGDGTVDGVIFADLCEGISEEWSAPNAGTNVLQVVPIDSDAVKDYYISQTSYTVPGASGYGTMPVLTATGSGADRFYVMALEDINEGEEYYYYWYKEVSKGVDSSITSIDFGSGKQNTHTMITTWNNKTYGSKHSLDIWRVIQDKVYGGKTKTLKNVKWFVPSLEEWVVFKNSLGNGSNYYSDYGLLDYYWTSSLLDSTRAYFIIPKALTTSPYVSFYPIKAFQSVRLATTF